MDDDWQDTADGGRYRGQRDPEGRRHGKGRWEDNTGQYYEGDWVEDLRHGCGTSLDKTGTFYRGDWITDIKHGKGQSENREGIVYDGDWENDLWHGQGKLTGKGITYTGNFKRGLYHGSGELRNEILRIVYDGEWVQGKKEGQGKLTCTTGGYYSGPEFIEVYEGGWKDDLRHGQGKQHFRDKSVYDGDWSEGLFHGKGKFSFGEKVVVDGFFNRGMIKVDMARPIGDASRDNLWHEAVKEKSGEIKRKQQDESKLIISHQVSRFAEQLQNPYHQDSVMVEDDTIEQLPRQRNPYLDTDDNIRPLHSNPSPQQTLNFEFTSLG